MSRGTATATPAHANSTPGMNKSMTTPLSEELREKIASELYARFWARNGVSEPPPWPNQAEAICDMWRSIASDAALSLLPVGWVGESGSSCVAEPGTVFPDAAELEALRRERDEARIGHEARARLADVLSEKLERRSLALEAAEASLREVQAHLLRIERAWRDQVSTTESKLLLEDVLATPHRGEEGKQGLSSSSVAESGGSRAQEPVKSDSHSHIEKEDL